jgi:prepilin-type N-terminal cleavage/methylation domain-containing protein
MKHHRKSAAFTLVEILVVIVIIGIAATLIIPQLSNANDLNAAAAGRVILADLTYAQNCAITTQRTHYVKFVVGTNSDTYSVLSQITPSEQVITHPVTQASFRQTLGSGGHAGLVRARLGTVSIGGVSGANTVAFDSLGSPYVYTAANGLVALSDAATIDIACGQDTLRLSVAPFTGEFTATVVTP